MEFRPAADHILVLPDEAEGVSPGGIIIPSGATEAPDTGLVIAVGRGRTMANGTLVPLVIEAGDRIVYAKYSGTPYKHNRVGHLIIRESDVLGTLVE